MKVEKPAKFKVERRSLDRAVRQIKARNAGDDPEALMALVDETVRTTRRERGTGEGVDGRREERFVRG